MYGSSKILLELLFARRLLKDRNIKWLKNFPPKMYQFAVNNQLM